MEKRPKFFDTFKGHLDELMGSGQLGTMGDWESQWIEAAKGLERFAGK